MDVYGTTECVPIVFGTNFTKGDRVHGLRRLSGWDIVDKTLHLRGNGCYPIMMEIIMILKIYLHSLEFFYWKGRSDNIVKKSGWKVVKKN